MCVYQTLNDTVSMQKYITTLFRSISYNAENFRLSILQYYLRKLTNLIPRFYGILFVMMPNNLIESRIFHGIIQCRYTVRDLHLE